MKQEERIIRTRKVLVAVMTTCLAADALTGCGSKKSDERVIKIGVFEPATGGNGDGGYQEVLGIRYAGEMHPIVNIGGEERTVKLVEVGNKSDKTEAVNAAQELANEKVGVVLGSYGSGASITAGQIFADAEIPVTGCSCTNPQVTEGDGFYPRVCLIDLFQGTVTANYAYQNGAKNAAVTTQPGGDYSSDLGLYFKDAFAKSGGNIVSEEQFRTNQIDSRAILTNIKTADPDVIFVPSSITTASLIIKQARELGIIATIAAGDTQESSTIIENAGADSEGVVLSTFFDKVGPANDEATAFIKGSREYLVKEKQEGIIPAVSALGYDPCLVAIKVIEGAGSTDIAATRDMFRNVEINGMTGNITLNETGGANKDIVFVKIIKDGKLQFLATTAVE